MNKFVSRKKCGICDSADLIAVLNLGEMPVSNNFLVDVESFEKEESFPLAVSICNDCKSLQLSYIVSPKFIFNNYSYTTGASTPLVDHFNKLADEIADLHTNSSDDLVVEIGSNDGSLLKRIKDRTKILGIDPAENIAEEAIKNGVPTIVGFFNKDLSQKIKDDYSPAKVIVANNVMAHIDNIQDVFGGVKNLLAPNGKFIFEVHWVGNLLNEGGFDQIYHEHFYYHSLHSLKVLLGSLGFVVNDIKSVPIHGESMRLYVSNEGEESKAVIDFLKKERAMGLHENEVYLNFSKKVEENKGKLKTLLSKLKGEGKKIFGYGAPSKGNTLLNYFNIGPETIDVLTDTTLAKQGKYAPGSHIKIVSPDILKTNPPDYILLLSWNYKDAILEKEKLLRNRGVKFIIPVPNVTIV